MAGDEVDVSLVGEAHLYHSHETENVLLIKGHWIRGASLPSVSELLDQLAHSPRQRLIIQSSIQSWDSRLPSYLFRIADYAQRQGMVLDTSQLPPGVQALLKLATTVPERVDAHRAAPTLSLSHRLGNRVLSFVAEGRQLVHFIGETLLATLSLLQGRARFRRIDLWINIQDAGPSALPIVTLIALLVGLILAFVGAVQLAMFGAQVYIADLVALGTVREMGTLMTAVIMSGRTGAAYAAQLGMMKVNNEIDALRTMGISPLEFLVLPRLLALTLVMPMLCLYADLMGIVGGAAVSLSIFDISPIQYYNELHKAVHLADFAIGLFKGLVFAVLIATAGCMRGLRCGSSASAVGDATTQAVVDSIVYIVIADSLITLICNRLDI